MKIFRYMSSEEFNKYRNGEKLTNNTDWAKKGRHTTSVGFCFFPYKDDYGIASNYKFVGGIVDSEMVAVFETDKELLKSSGLYADVSPEAGFFDMISADEYSTTEYDADSFKLVKFGRIVAIHDDDWFDDRYEFVESEECA